MIPKSYTTVSEATNDLMKLGYTLDFSLLTDKDCLVCQSTSLELSPEEFEIDQIHRFEGDSDPGDEMIVYAISSKTHNVKGIVVNAFGVYADSISSKIVSKLHQHKENS